jgi:hypothetical protein
MDTCKVFLDGDVVEACVGFSASTANFGTLTMGCSKDDDGDDGFLKEDEDECLCDEDDDEETSFVTDDSASEKTAGESFSFLTSGEKDIEGSEDDDELLSESIDGFLEEDEECLCDDEEDDDKTSFVTDDSASEKTAGESFSFLTSGEKDIEGSEDDDELLSESIVTAASNCFSWQELTS